MFGTRTEGRFLGTQKKTDERHRKQSNEYHSRGKKMRKQGRRQKGSPQSAGKKEVPARRRKRPLVQRRKTHVRCSGGGKKGKSLPRNWNDSGRKRYCLSTAGKEGLNVLIGRRLRFARVQNVLPKKSGEGRGKKPRSFFRHNGRTIQKKNEASQERNERISRQRKKGQGQSSK